MLFTSSFLRGVLFELLGACLVLLASSYSTLGWIPAIGHLVQTQPGTRMALVGPGALAAGCVLMLLGYGLALGATRYERPRLISLLGATLLLALPLMLLLSIPPGGLNRATVLPQEPLRHIGSRVLAAVVGETASPATSLIVAKSLAIVALLLGAALIWRLLGKFASHAQARGTWIYAGNPLVLLAFAGAGHNHGLLIVVVLSALLFQVRGWTSITVLVMGLTGLLSWPMLLLVPPYLAWLYSAPGLRRRTTFDLIAGLVLLAALVALLYGIGHISVPALSIGANAVVLELIGPSGPGQALRLSSLALFVAWYLALLPRARGIRDLPVVWGWSLFAFVSLGSPGFQPWHITWLLALGAVVPSTLLARSSLVFGVMGLFFILGPATGTMTGVDIDSILPYLWLPPLLYAFVGYIRRRTSVPDEAPPVHARRYEQARPW